ncbi:hypothetical protein ACJX0J_037436, partial [Zea mays]
FFNSDPVAIICVMGIMHTTFLYYVNLLYPILLIIVTRTLIFFVSILISLQKEHRFSHVREQVKNAWKNSLPLHRVGFWQLARRLLIMPLMAHKMTRIYITHFILVKGPIKI